MDADGKTAEAGNVNVPLSSSPGIIYIPGIVESVVRDKQD